MKPAWRIGAVLVFSGLVLGVSSTQMPADEAVTAVPSSVVVKVRRRVLAMERLPAQSKVYVMTKTRPVINLFALRKRGCSSPLDRQVNAALDSREEELVAKFKPIPVQVGSSSAERARLVGVGSFREVPNLGLTLEFSSPVVNPYPKSGEQRLGLFVRFSGAGFGGTWYWVVLRRQGSTWEPGKVSRLDVAE